MRRYLIIFTSAALVLIFNVSVLAAEIPSKFNFPNTSDGREVLAIDLHTHSVFSDGEVWPTLRVKEAAREGLAAYAPTEHLEYQPHSADIPHPDRNRSYQIATEEAKNHDVLVIPGAEITRGVPPGHVNAVFIDDANKLLINNDRHDNGKRTEQQVETAAALKAIAVANGQGAFVFWNHPYFPPHDNPGGTSVMGPVHKKLFKQKKLHGIEIANANDHSGEAFAAALKYNLTLLGNSDVHGLVDWNEWPVYKGGNLHTQLPDSYHRTVTLVLVDPKKDRADGIKDSLFNRATAVYYHDKLLGRQTELSAIVGGALTLSISDPKPSSLYPEVIKIILTNHSPMDFYVRHRGDYRFFNQIETLRIPAHASEYLIVKEIKDPSDFKGLKLEVLNALTAPDQNLTLTLKPQ